MFKKILITFAALSSMFLLLNYAGQYNDRSGENQADLAYLDLFAEFQREHNKKYSSPSEERYRLSVFAANSRMIDEHNKSNSSYTLGMNQLGDMTWEELKNFYLADMTPGDLPTCDGEIPSKKKESLLGASGKNTKHTKVQDNGKDEPVTETQFRFAEDAQKVDWYEAGKVTAVKNQGQCGSCYAFSAVASTESLYMIKYNKQVNLSEQQIVDCSRDYGNHGCGGGLVSRCFHYAMEHSLESEADYPYKGQSQQCAEDSSKAVVKLSGCTKVETNMNALLSAIRIQPVSVAFEALMEIFFYKFGIYHPKHCGKQVNHAVLAAGFDLTYKMPYLLIKNSWGKWWGRSGYLYMAIGEDPNGYCNIAGSGHNFVPKLD